MSEDWKGNMSDSTNHSMSFSGDCEADNIKVPRCIHAHAHMHTHTSPQSLQCYVAVTFPVKDLMDCVARAIGG